MNPQAKTITAGIASADAGGFTAVASSPTVDRDGESMAAGCFDPLPASIPVHLDHSFSAAATIGRARPYYIGQKLYIDVSLASTGDAQTVRTKLAEGVLDSISIVFRGLEWRQVDDVRTCVRGELLAADVVSIPSQPDAVVLGVRGGYRQSRSAALRAVLMAARQAMIAVDLAEAKRILADQPATVPLDTRSARRLLRKAMEGL